MEEESLNDILTIIFLIPIFPIIFSPLIEKLWRGPDEDLAIKEELKRQALRKVFTYL